MNTQDGQHGPKANQRAVVTDARRLFEILGIDLRASEQGEFVRACMLTTEGGAVDLMQEKLFAHTPEGVENDEVMLVFSDPHVGILAGEILHAGGDLSVEVAQVVAGEIERRWNIYPMLVKALRELRAYVGEPQGDDGVLEIMFADSVLSRVDVEESGSA